MLTAKTQYSLANAKDYFAEHLCVGDYYEEGQRVSGEWFGLGAERLGLSGRVGADEFLRLCENQHPTTGDRLTQRLNTTRAAGGQDAANRRIFYDFTFSPPKSVSLAALLGEDARIGAMHEQAVRAALRELETFAGTRIRRSGGQSDRLTGNFTAALFTHDTSRALDPHLHTHCVLFNATFDTTENRWKALQNYEMKQEELSREELRALWGAQLTEGERDILRDASKGITAGGNVEKPLAAREAVQWAEEHLFDRKSVVLECQMWQEALGRARGQSFSVAELKGITEQRGYIRNEARPAEVTLREVLLREWEIVQSVSEGVGECSPLLPAPRPSNPKLDEEQRQALEGLLRSINVVTLFRGGAGTGKSFVLRELVEEVRAAGQDVVVLARQRQQVVEMEQAGFPMPSTLSSFLLKRELAQRAVVIVDEAGQIGGRQMLDLLRLVRARNARLVLSGDTRQHGAVEASDGLLAIERHSGVRPVELRTPRSADCRRRAVASQSESEAGFGRSCHQR